MSLSSPRYRHRLSFEQRAELRLAIDAARRDRLFPRRTSRQREAQALRRDGLTYTQIAERLGISPAAVHDRLFPELAQARQQARKARLRAEREDGGQ